jgi:hypothetical protein
MITEQDVEIIVKKCLLESLSSSKAIQSEKPVVKSVDKEKRLFTAVVLRPNVADSQGDIYDEDVVEKACHDYNEFCRQANIQHLIQTNLIVPVESYIAKSSFKLGEGEVAEGDWVMTSRIDDDELWDMCKSGDFTGYSVGCKALVETLDDK